MEGSELLDELSIFRGSFDLVNLDLFAAGATGENHLGSKGREYLLRGLCFNAGGGAQVSSRSGA